jgi:mutator protein MutT
MIEYDKNFLLVSRNNDEENFPNLWAFPGGKVELYETVVHTIRREVKEETGLSLRDDIVFLDTYTFGKSVGIAFLVRALSNKIILCNELTSYKWVSSVDDLKKLNCIPGIYNHLVNALKKLNENDFDSMEAVNLTEDKYINKTIGEQL